MKIKCEVCGKMIKEDGIGYMARNDNYVVAVCKKHKTVERVKSLRKAFKRFFR